MTRYVALLRGITPLNPNMRNDKLRSVFENLGYENVRTVIASGNVLFESRSRNAGALEARIEKALSGNLRFSSSAIVRSREQLQKLVDRNPFGNLEDTSGSRLNVTFLKHAPRTRLKFPYRPADKAYELRVLYDGAICSVVDLSDTGTPDLMRLLEREFGKAITTRTWKTVRKILDKLNDS